MELLNGIWTYVIPFIAVLTVLVFVHELGHYSIARYCGVRVEVFSIGFGPEIFGYTSKKSGTRWKFAAIPFLANQRIMSQSRSQRLTVVALFGDRLGLGGLRAGGRGLRPAPPGPSTTARHC